jgi:hypothetical protein
MIDKILSKLELLIGEDERIIERAKKDYEMVRAEANDKLPEVEALRRRIMEAGYYEGAGVEALKKWRAMSEEERAAQRRGDEVDEVNTTDLESD